MPLLPLIDYEDATPEVRAVYDDLMQTRGTNWINNFWKVLANHPETLARVWEDVKTVMKPGALDPLVKEMIYVAVSATNNCEYCIAVRTWAIPAVTRCTKTKLGDRLPNALTTFPPRFPHIRPDPSPTIGHREPATKERHLRIRPRAKARPDGTSRPFAAAKDRHQQPKPNPAGLNPLTHAS